MTENIIEIQKLQNFLGNQWVHKDINLTIKRGEIVAIIGGSGCGKTTLIRSILMLHQQTAGTIKVFGQDIGKLDANQANILRQRWGMLFQHSALFSAMSVLENIQFPMREFTTISKQLMHQLAMFKLNLVGLPKEAAVKLPSELSGGMQRRAAAARAIAMDPELLFLDEPTTGLDPISARKFDDLVLFLRDTLNLTIVMISHDVESLKKCTDKIAFIGEGKVLSFEPYNDIRENKHPLIMEYFSNF